MACSGWGATPQLAPPRGPGASILDALQLAARTHRATLTTRPDGLAFWVSLSVGMEKPRRLT